MTSMADGHGTNARHRQGNQGILDAASNSQLENEFGTHKEEDVVKAILEKGDLQEVDVRISFPTTLTLASTQALLTQ